MTDLRRHEILTMSLLEIGALTQTDWNTWTREELDLLSEWQRAEIDSSIKLPV